MQLLRFYVRGMVLEAYALDDGGTHIVSRRDQQHQGAWGRFCQYLAHALFRAGDLCNPRHQHHPVRVVQLHVSPASVHDDAAHIAEHHVIERLPIDAPDGDTHHDTFLINESVHGHDDGRPTGHPHIRFRDWQERTDDAHGLPSVDPAILSQLTKRRRTPAQWLPATWRATLPPEVGGAQGLSFDLPAGQVIRLRLDAASVRHVVETLAPGYFCDIRCQSGRVEVPRGNAFKPPVYWAAEDLAECEQAHGTESAEYKARLDHFSLLLKTSLPLLLKAAMSNPAYADQPSSARSAP